MENDALKSPFKNTGDYRDDPAAVSVVSLATLLFDMDLPGGTRLRHTKEGVEITEPGKEPYTLRVDGEV